MTTLTCKLPERLAAQLDALAREQRSSKSAILREALEARLFATPRLVVHPMVWSSTYAVQSTVAHPTSAPTQNICKTLASSPQVIVDTAHQWHFYKRAKTNHAWAAAHFASSLRPS